MYVDYVYMSHDNCKLFHVIYSLLCLLNFLGHGVYKHTVSLVGDTLVALEVPMGLPLIIFISGRTNSV